jgi:chitin synthase
VFFIVSFCIVLTVQFIAMLFHRFGTLSHMLATTQINWFKRAAQVGTVNSIPQ